MWVLPALVALPCPLDLPVLDQRRTKPEAPRLAPSGHAVPSQSVCYESDPVPTPEAEAALSQLRVPRPLRAKPGEWAPDPGFQCDMRSTGHDSSLVSLHPDGFRIPY